MNPNFRSNPYENPLKRTKKSKARKHWIPLAPESVWEDLEPEYWQGPPTTLRLRSGAALTKDQIARLIEHGFGGTYPRGGTVPMGGAPGRRRVVRPPAQPAPPPRPPRQAVKPLAPVQTAPPPRPARQRVTHCQQCNRPLSKRRMADYKPICVTCEKTNATAVRRGVRGGGGRSPGQRAKLGMTQNNPRWSRCESCHEQPAKLFVKITNLESGVETEHRICKLCAMPIWEVL